MSTIANAKVAHNYNRYNGYFFGCLPTVIMGTLSDGYIVILFYKDCFGCKSSIYQSEFQTDSLRNHDKYSKSLRTNEIHQFPYFIRIAKRKHCCKFIHKPL